MYFSIRKRCLFLRYNFLLVLQCPGCQPLPTHFWTLQFGKISFLANGESLYPRLCCGWTSLTLRHPCPAMHRNRKQSPMILQPCWPQSASLSNSERILNYGTLALHSCSISSDYFVGEMPSFRRRAGKANRERDISHWCTCGHCTHACRVSRNRQR